MKLLLDTCSFLWLVTENSQKITPKAETLFLDGRNRVLFSAVSAWEISIKWSIGKLELTSPVHEFLTKQILLNKLTILPIHLEHAIKVAELPFHHKDPFDRLLIAQSIIEEIPLLSADPTFDLYGVHRVWA